MSIEIEGQMQPYSVIASELKFSRSLDIIVSAMLDKIYEMRSPVKKEESRGQEDLAKTFAIRYPIIRQSLFHEYSADALASRDAEHLHYLLFAADRVFEGDVDFLLRQYLRRLQPTERLEFMAAIGYLAENVESYKPALCTTPGMNLDEKIEFIRLIYQTKHVPPKNVQEETAKPIDIKGAVDAALSRDVRYGASQIVTHPWSESCVLRPAIAVGCLISVPVILGSVFGFGQYLKGLPAVQAFFANLGMYAR